MYVLLIVCVLIILVIIYLFVYRKYKLLKNMTNAVDMVKLGLFERITVELEKKYEKEEIDYLAAAIINDLFSEEPTEEKAIAYKVRNRKKILNEIMDFKNDSDLCYIITQAVRVRSVVKYAKNKKDVDVDPLIKLDEYGILLKGINHLSPSEFYEEAYNFYNSV